MRMTWGLMGSGEWISCIFKDHEKQILEIRDKKVREETCGWPNEVDIKYEALCITYQCPTEITFHGRDTKLPVRQNDSASWRHCYSPIYSCASTMTLVVLLILMNDVQGWCGLLLTMINLVTAAVKCSTQPAPEPIYIFFILEEETNRPAGMSQSNRLNPKITEQLFRNPSQIKLAMPVYTRSFDFHLISQMLEIFYF